MEISQSITLWVLGFIAIFLYFKVAFGISYNRESTLKYFFGFTLITAIFVLIAIAGLNLASEYKEMYEKKWPKLEKVEDVYRIQNEKN